ncbi:MAG: RNA-dependent DNA polymerase, partial [Deltaproteobacteria bacterium]|nr:RNA-dependent DNA polymerase [Deltaproteobacteria bacterium]
YRESALAFNFDLERNLIRLQRELSDQSYEPGPYRDFVVRDSKKRLISAAPYRDRVVHHAIINVIEPLFDPSFIDDSFACRKGKGTHAALARFRGWLPNYRYVLKCDIRKYFQSIDHEILTDMLARRIGDTRVMWLLGKVIASRDFNDTAPVWHFPCDDLLAPAERRRGIPVGNLTSQFFANLYLDGFDHWVKEGLKARAYLRYVDDFCVFGDEKSELGELRAEFVDKLHELRLRIHPGKSRVYTLKEGVEFLGFRHLRGRVRLRRENVRRFIARMRRYQADYKKGLVTLDKVRASLIAWSAHAEHAESEALRRRLIPSFSFG